MVEKIEELKDTDVYKNSEVMAFYNDQMALIMKHNLPVFSILGVMRYIEGWLVNYGLSREEVPQKEAGKDVQDGEKVG